MSQVTLKDLLFPICIANEDCDADATVYGFGPMGEQDASYACDRHAEGLTVTHVLRRTKHGFDMTPVRDRKGA